LRERIVSSGMAFGLEGSPGQQRQNRRTEGLLLSEAIICN